MATHFFWDPDEDNIIQERDDTGTITAEYTTEPYLYGNLISQNRDGVVSQYHFDSQGSTLALTDDNQNVTDTYAYTAFGELVERSGNTHNPFLFLGQQQARREEHVNIYINRQRPFEANLNRWLTPLTFRSQLSNQYTFVTQSLIPNSDGNRFIVGPPNAGELSAFSGNYYVGEGIDFNKYMQGDRMPWEFPQDSTSIEWKKLKLPFGAYLPYPVEVRRRIGLNHVCNDDGFGNRVEYDPCDFTLLDPDMNGRCGMGNGELVPFVEFNTRTMEYVITNKCLRCSLGRMACKEGHKCTPCLSVTVVLRPIGHGVTVRVDSHKWFCKCLKFEMPKEMGCNELCNGSFCLV